MLRLAYFADDFTGATDALESLASSGLRTRLFLDAPTVEQLAEHPGLEAVGVAGLTRSLPPQEIAQTLRPAFAALRALGPSHVYYKVCSTFDSSPTIGSIGRAIEVGQEVFGGSVVPLLVAAPALGRYCAFGNLFARYGIGSDGPIYRLDRHPAVSAHPVTPMNEADIRKHLLEQTDFVVGLVDVSQIEQGPEALERTMRMQMKDGADIVLFDALTETHLHTIGIVLDPLGSSSRPLFSVGSSGLGTALVSPHATPSKLPAYPTGLPPAKAPLLVVSGSCSPVTAAQIEWAESQGFAIVPFGEQATEAAAAALSSGRHTIVCSSRGVADEKLFPASHLGTALGRLASGLIAVHGVRRLVVVGGDTSSYAARALGIESLEMIAPLAPGAPWCRARAPGSAVDGCEVNFKGGQVGAPDYFGAAARGKL